MRATGNGPRIVTRSSDGSPVARNVSGIGLQADEVSPCALLLDLGQCVAADEVAFRKLHRPTEAGFVRIDRLVHVISIQAKSRFEASGVAGTEARRQHPGRFSLHQDGVPDLPDTIGLDE